MPKSASGGAGSSEESDHRLNQQRECGDRIGGRSQGVLTCAAGRLRENDQHHQERDDVQIQRYLGDILNPFGADVGHRVAPDDRDDREQRASHLRITADSAEDELGREERTDGKPADLQDAHQQPGHQVSALGPERRTTYHIEREPGLHAQHCRSVVVQQVAQQTCDGERKHADAEAGAVDGPDWRATDKKLPREKSRRRWARYSHTRALGWWAGSEPL